jgi:hypothetical protein
MGLSPLFISNCEILILLEVFENTKLPSSCLVKGIIDDSINTAVKTAEVDEQKTKYLQHFINKHDTIVSN